MVGRGVVRLARQEMVGNPPVRTYRIEHPAVREGVSALPDTEFVEYTFIGENVQRGKEGTGFEI